MNKIYNIVCESVIISELDIKNAAHRIGKTLKNYGNDISFYAQGHNAYRKLKTKSNPTFGNSVKQTAKAAGNFVADAFGRQHFRMAKHIEPLDADLARQARMRGLRNAALSTAVAYGGYKAIKAMKNRRAAKKRQQEEEAATKNK